MSAEPMVSGRLLTQQVAVIERSATRRQVIDGELTVEWRHVVATGNPRVVKFTDGVKAEYGLTTVYADELTLYLDETQRHGEAIGHVRLEDPEGSAAAAKLEFNWKDKTGTAFDVHTQVEELTVDARKIDIKPDEWNIYDFSATNSQAKHPAYVLLSPHAVIQPGRRAVIERPKMRVFGTNLGPFPKLSMALDQRTTGVTLPVLTYRRDRGVGVNWASSLLVNDETALTGAFSAYKGFSPSYGFQASRSFLEPERTDRLIVPRTELDERFNTSYFENVGVPTADYDEGYIRSPRKTAAVGTFRNVAPGDRLDNALYTKPIDVVYEQSGALSDLGYMAQMRVQSVRRNKESSYSRLVAGATIDTRPHVFARGLEGHLRTDASGFLGGTTFGWIRAEGGLSYKPSSTLGFGAALFAGREAGDSLYADDRLYVRQGYSLRGDLNVGPRKISLIQKYDLDNHLLYDREIAFTQVMGGLEVFAVYRKFPGDYHVGLRLRIDHFMAAIRRRKVARSAKSEPAQASK